MAPRPRFGSRGQRRLAEPRRSARDAALPDGLRDRRGPRLVIGTTAGLGNPETIALAVVLAFVFGTR